MLTVDHANQQGPLGMAAMGINARGAVILAGYCESGEVLTSSISEGLAGLILGSLPARLIPLVQTLPYPVLVLGGFGSFGLDEISKKFLSNLSGSEISLNCARWDRLSGERPEAYVAVAREGSVPLEPDDITAGQTVRINSGPFCGKIGVIERVIPGLTMLQSGLRVAAANVSVNERVGEVIPLANLEIMQTGESTNVLPG
jgi:hypothetical protein